MPKIATEVELNIGQIKEAIEQLRIKDKIKLVQELDKQTWPARFKNLLYRIDKRIKNRRIPSDEEIVQIVRKVRKHNYAQSHH